MFNKLKKEDFKALYPKGNARGRLNKAVRREIPGGGRILDLITETVNIRNRSYSQKDKDLAEYYLAQLNEIADEMRESIYNKYNLGNGKELQAEVEL
jgi:hypothetical protein